LAAAGKGRSIDPHTDYLAAKGRPRRLPLWLALSRPPKCRSSD